MYVRQKSSLKRAGIIVSLIGALLMMFLVFGAYASSAVTNYGERTSTEEKDEDADIIFEAEISIGPDVDEEFQNNVGDIIMILYFVSICLITYSSIMLLLNKHEKYMMILSTTGSAFMLIGVSLALENCCAVVFMIFPMTCIVGNVLMWIGNYYEKNLVK